MRTRVSDWGGGALVGKSAPGAVNGLGALDAVGGKP